MERAALVVAALAFDVSAEIYRCVDEHGTPTFSDRPCASALASPHECSQRRNGLRTFDSVACSGVETPPTLTPKAPIPVVQAPKGIRHPPIPVTFPDHAGNAFNAVTENLEKSVRSLTKVTWLSFAFLGLLAALIQLLRTPSAKGWIGEWRVHSRLTKFLPGDVYKIFRDVTLVAADGSTQVDHLVLSKYGLFVVETKNMSGWIFGTARQPLWTQQFFRFRTGFQNPLRQNYRHIVVLEEVLGLSQDRQIGIVVFTGSAVFKTGIPEGVVALDGLIDEIRSHDRELISAVEVESLASRISEIRLTPGRRANKAHVDDLRRRHGEVVAPRGKWGRGP